MPTQGETTSRPLDGRVALVTGASRGIGRAIALELGMMGARVALGYRREDERAKEAVAALESHGVTARGFRADISRSDEAQRLIVDVLGAFGSVDVLVNNAAIQRAALLHKMSDADWHEVMDTNLSAVFYLCRAVLPSMLQARRGHIVNVASASAFMGQRGAASYVASKHGLIGLTRALAVETASAGILVNAVAPGLTDTDLVRDLTPEQRESLLRMVPLRRIASPEEVAAMVGFVVTRAGYSTGNVFHVSGGVVMA
jgi:NAD(P)-dependent dehydrogenase (short-subunit alcohol dehydrogenase family)